jgi:hypothetical protein
MDLIFAEKYNWTPQQIDEIPSCRMEEMMMVLNMRLNIDEEVKSRGKYQKGGKKDGPPVIGEGMSGGVKYHQEL